MALQLRRASIWWGINVACYAPIGSWLVCVQKLEKVITEGFDVITLVWSDWDTLYSKQPVNLPAYQRLVQAQIPSGVPGDRR